MLPFKLENIMVIIGVSCVGDIVSLRHKGDSSDFEYTYLNKMYNQHRDVIKNNLFRLVRGKSKTEETFVKLLVVFFMTIIFFLNTSLNAPIFVARYANKLKTIDNYA